jgi:hypothetical protein
MATNPSRHLNLFSWQRKKSPTTDKQSDEHNTDGQDHNPIVQALQRRKSSNIDTLTKDYRHHHHSQRRESSTSHEKAVNSHLSDHGHHTQWQGRKSSLVNEHAANGDASVSLKLATVRDFLIYMQDFEPTRPADKWLRTGSLPLSTRSFCFVNTQEEAKVRWDSDEELRKVSKSLLSLQKWCLIFVLSTTNGVLIYLGWAYSKLYWGFLILLSSNTLLQSVMIVGIMACFVFTRVKCFFSKQKENKPKTPETMVMLLPCYNESNEELTKSIESLLAQKEIDEHPKLILIVVDGNVKGPGMEKTTQKYLLEDILDSGYPLHFENGYRARDGLFMPIDTQIGVHKGIPYIFIVKSYNQDKRPRQARQLVLCPLVAIPLQ